MKTLVFEIRPAVPDALFGDEGLTTLRQLREMGCFGRLRSAGAWRPEALWDVLRQHGKRVERIGTPESDSLRSAGEKASGLADTSRRGLQSLFEQFGKVLEADAWDVVHLAAIGFEQPRRAVAEHADPTRDAVQEVNQVLDAALAGLLERLDGETAVLVVATGPEAEIDSGKREQRSFGSFLLAIPTGALSGEVEDIGFPDLEATLLELAGLDLSGRVTGHCLLSRASASESREAPEEDEEELIRQRLSGLGYI